MAIIASIRLIASAASGDSDVSFNLPLCRSENLEVNLKSIVRSPFLEQLSEGNSSTSPKYSEDPKGCGYREAVY